MTQEARNLLEQLPGLLREDPDLRYRLYAILEEHFPPRKEMADLLAELRAMREASEQRWEESQRRWEETRRGFEETRRGFEEARRERQDAIHTVNVKVGGFTRRAGRGLEDAIAGTLRLGLGIRDVRAEDIRMRERLTDDEGLIGPAGRSYEYDIVMPNGETWIFEVKSAPDEEDVDRFADKCELVARKLGLKAPRRILVTLALPPEVEGRCIERGIERV